MKIHTIGHSIHAIDSFIGLLAGAGVTLLVDVRSVPRSRRNPQFNVDALPGSLAEAGIDYRHLKALGGLRGRRSSDTPSPNTYWTVSGFRNYADYALTPPFHEGLADLTALAERVATGIMCAEALWWQCHRRIVADYLLAAGVEVVHILSSGKHEAAKLTAAAVPQPDGTLHYPPDQPKLFMSGPTETP